MAALPGRAEVKAAFVGVWRLMRFDPAGFACFDASPRGFWHSFWAAALLAPVLIILTAAQMMLTPPQSPFRFIAYQVIGYAIGWLLWPLMMTRLSDWLGRGDRFLVYMAGYNWFRLAQVAILLPSTLLDLSGAPVGVTLLLWLAGISLLLAYQWFLARHGLKVSASTAIALAIIDFLLSLLIDYLSDTLP